MKRLITIFIIIILFGGIPVLSIEQSNIKQTNLPDSFCYRDIDGVDYTTPVRDQSPAPTCEAYGICAALETIIQYQTKEIFSPDLSECHLYFYAGGTYESGYVNLKDAANYSIDYGVPDEGCYPDPHRAFDYPYESVPGWENRTVKIQSWGWVNHDTESIKQALIDYGPLIFCMSLYKDFLYYKFGVYEHKWGDRYGGHVMTIVGYDDNNQCWIVKNSWGTKWGENGWFKLAYDANLIAQWYGPGTGIMYLDGVYGNFKPDTPKIQIEKPYIYHSYLFGIKLPIFFKKLPIQKGAPRIIGGIFLKIKTENTDKVEYYVDGKLKYTDDKSPFIWRLRTLPGLNTIETIAYNEYGISRDIVDVFVYI
jgi:hypothetical protein